MHVWRTDGFPIPYWDRVILLVMHMTMRGLPGTILPLLSQHSLARAAGMHKTVAHLICKVHHGLIVRIQKVSTVNLHHSLSRLVSEPFCFAQAVNKICMAGTHGCKQASKVPLSSFFRRSEGSCLC